MSTSKAKSKNKAAPARRATPTKKEAQTGDVTAFDEAGNERVFRGKVWHNLPQAEKDKFKSKKPAELKTKAAVEEEAVVVEETEV